MSTHTARTHAFALLVAATLAACGGGGGGGGVAGSIQGLAAPSQVSVVTPDGSSDGSASVAPGATQGGGVTPHASPPAGSQYETDVAHVYVFDPSMKTLDTINEILCMTGLTAYDQMVNRGDYVAQIDESLAQKGGSGESQAGQSSGAQGGQIKLWTVNSSRAANDADQIVHFWVPNDDDHDLGPNTIFARMAIAQGADEAHPFGAFDLDFAGAPDAGSLANPLMFGSLATLAAAQGRMGFGFYMQSGDVNQAPAPGSGAQQASVTVEMASDQSGGAARVRQLQRYNDPVDGDSGILIDEYRIAFNPQHLKRSLNGGGEVTLSRGQFHTNVWRYNLYHASGAHAGERVELNSGFSFHDAQNRHGYIGYWGLWTPPGVALSSGDTIWQDTYDGSQGAAYTLLSASGKLIRFTRNTLDLVDLGTQTFHWWDGASGLEYQVDYHLGAFWKLASRAGGSQEWTAIPPEVIDVAALGGWLNMWSESLGGSVSYVDGDSFVTYFAQTFVNSADPLFDTAVNGQVELYGFVDCLKAALTGPEVEQGAIFLPVPPDVGSPHVYRMDQQSLTLFHDADGSGTNLVAAGLAPGEAPTGGPFLWGMRSGPLLPDVTGIQNVWDVWNQPVFYCYETGPNAWNHYASALDALGLPVEFDAPLQFTYTHSTANDRNGDATYDGQSFFFGYGGPGNLWGIPSDPVDLTGEGQPDRWLPRFDLLDGLLCGPTGTEYLVRAMEMEQTLEVDPAGDPALDLTAASALSLPDASSYTTPSIGPKPLVTDPPAVINGVVQGEQP